MIFLLVKKILMNKENSVLACQERQEPPVNVYLRVYNTLKSVVVDFTLTPDGFSSNNE